MWHSVLYYQVKYMVQSRALAHHISWFKHHEALSLVVLLPYVGWFMEAG